MLARLGHEAWIGDAAKIRASEVRRQKRYSSSVEAAHGRTVSAHLDTVRPGPRYLTTAERSTKKAGLDNAFVLIDAAPALGKGPARDNPERPAVIPISGIMFSKMVGEQAMGR